MYKKFFFIIPCITLLLFGIVNAKSNDFHALIKYVALGDSITYGVGDPDRIGFVGRIKEFFEHQYDSKLTVKNFGVSKYRTEQILEQLEKSKVKKELSNADIITLFIGTNDFRKSANYNFKQVNEVSLHTGETIYINRLLEIFRRLRALNPNAPILVLGMYNPYSIKFERFIDEWNSEIQHVAKQFQNVQYIPTEDIFRHNDYYADKLHPNQIGYELLAKRVFEKIQNIEGEK